MDKMIVVFDGPFNDGEVELVGIFPVGTDDETMREVLKVEWAVFTRYEKREVPTYWTLDNGGKGK